MFIPSFITDIIAGILFIYQFRPLPEFQYSTLSEYPHILILKGTTEVHCCYHLFNHVDLNELDVHPLSTHALKLCENITWCRPHRSQLLSSSVNSYVAVVTYIILT